MEYKEDLQMEITDTIRGLKQVVVQPANPANQITKKIHKKSLDLSPKSEFLEPRNRSNTVP